MRYSYITFFLERLLLYINNHHFCFAPVHFFCQFAVLRRPCAPILDKWSWPRDWRDRRTPAKLPWSIEATSRATTGQAAQSVWCLANEVPAYLRLCVSSNFQPRRVSKRLIFGHNQCMGINVLTIIDPVLLQSMLRDIRSSRLFATKTGADWSRSSSKVRQ